MKPSKHAKGVRLDRHPPNEFGPFHVDPKSACSKDTGAGQSGAERVAIVDDDADSRLALECILAGSDDFNCAGCFSNAEEALAEIPRIRPDLVLMDIRMPNMNGIECTRRLKPMMPHLKIVIVTGLIDSNSIDESLAAGAIDYLIKPVSAAQCLATLKSAVYGRPGLEHKAQDLEQNSCIAAASKVCSLLTEREAAVMECLTKGFRYKEIEDALGESHASVKRLQHSAFVKLGASNGIEAVVRWLSQRSVQP